MQINIKTNLNEFQKSISAAAYQQIPFATAQALTALAKRVAEAEKENEVKVLDRPKPFTQNALGVVGASKKRLTAIVFMKDITAAYLEPYEFGGKNMLNGKAVLTPIGATKADLDQYGNLPRNWLEKMKGRKDIFIGKVRTKSGFVSGVWQRTVVDGNKVTIAKTTKKGAVRITQTRRGINTTGHLKLLLRFTDAHNARQHLGWFDVAKRVVERRFTEEMGRAISKALATAKK